MPHARIVWAAVLASAMLSSPRADALDSHTLITHCAASAGAGLRGLAAIRRVCPGIDEAVASLGLGGMLPAGWELKASPAALAGLDALAQRYAGRPSSALPPASDLRAIARGLQQTAPSAHPARAAPSWWDRFKAWLRRRLAPAAVLLRWLRALPGGTGGAGAGTLVLVLASALIVLGLVAIVIRELRAAGLFGSGRRSRWHARRRRAGRQVLTLDDEPGGDIDPAQALERPASALRLLVAALRRSRRIERDGNLTCREVLARAIFDTQGQRESFAGIAVLAERELFGPRGPDIRVPDELRPALEALYGQLSAAPAARSAAA